MFPGLPSDSVRTPSLYYHFTDRSEILKAIARHLAEISVVKPGQSSVPDWPEYFVTIVLSFRKSVLRQRVRHGCY